MQICIFDQISPSRLNTLLFEKSNNKGNQLGSVFYRSDSERVRIARTLFLFPSGNERQQAAALSIERRRRQPRNRPWYERRAPAAVR